MATLCPNLSSKVGKHLDSRVPSLHGRKKSLEDPELKEGMEVEFEVEKIGTSLVKKKVLTGVKEEEVYKVGKQKIYKYL